MGAGAKRIKDDILFRFIFSLVPARDGYLFFEVAASVDRVRGHSSEENFSASFSPTTKFNLGIAPSQGLYLERPFYEGHNKQ